MSIKSIKKTLWIATSFLTLLLFPLLFMTFFMSKVDAQKVPDLPAIPKKQNNGKKTLMQYSPVWLANINTEAPIVKTETKKDPIPQKTITLESILPGYLEIHSILSDNLAIVILRQGNKHEIIRTYDAEQDQQLIDVGDESQRSWEVMIPGKKLLVEKIVLGDGILFKFKDEQGWLKVKQVNGVDNSIRKIPRSRKLGENHWVMTNDEAEKMYENYDSYIKDLGLITDNDGIRVRRIPEGSQAEFYGLQKNDVVTDFNGVKLNFDELTSKASLRKFAKKFRNTKTFKLGVIRGGQKIQLRFDQF